ncbi:hypothetical protein CAEBREN_20817 [Caenorhabditis brenneri]|uniref:Uncharacterized protein n=1 Tax=Caenorhabditis brenneri TaxID=135651 RepID=G0MYB2_CAEBE|nr:hypothetical protein CAEBREN_20817 [Caenorhabditis brenneri]
MARRSATRGNSPVAKRTRSSSRPRRSVSRPRRSASRPRARASTPAPDTRIRKDDVVLATFHGDIPVSKESTKDWIVFEALEVDLSAEIREIMKNHPPLKTILDNYESDEKRDCSLKLQSKKIYAFSSKEQIYYNVDITEITASGKVRLHWHAYPRAKVVLKRFVDNGEEAVADLKDRLELVEIENELLKEEVAALNDDLLRSQNQIEALTEQMAQFNMAPPELNAEVVAEFFGEIDVLDAPIHQENQFFNFEYEMPAPQQHQGVVDAYNAADDEEPAEVVPYFAHDFLNAAEMDDQFPVGNMEDVIA